MKKRKSRSKKTDETNLVRFVENARRLHPKLGGVEWTDLATGWWYRTAWAEHLPKRFYGADPQTARPAKGVRRLSRREAWDTLWYFGWEDLSTYILSSRGLPEPDGMVGRIRRDKVWSRRTLVATVNGSYQVWAGYRWLPAQWTGSSWQITSHRTQLETYWLMGDEEAAVLMEIAAAITDNSQI